MGLREDNYDVTETECPECETGVLWVNSFELTCSCCGIVMRKDTRQRVRRDDPVEAFQKRRDDYCYENSGEPIMQGGFFDRQTDIEPEDNGIYGMGYSEDQLQNTRRRW